MQTVDIEGVKYIRIDHTDRLSEFRRVIPKPMPTTPLRKSLIRSGVKWECSWCGDTNNLEAHHIEPAVYNKTAKGHYHQVHSKSNHSKDNGAVLCKVCHIKLHQVGHGHH